MIRLDDGRFTPDSVAALEEFSHVEVIFLFDQFDEAKVALGARPRRGNEARLEVGTSPSAPARVRTGSGSPRVSCDGRDVRVRGLGAIDATPVLDIKPYLREFGPRGDVRQPPWSSELMAGDW